MRMHISTASTDLDPLPRLWAAARTLLAEMIALFGAPAALTALACLDRTLRRALLPRLRSLEELVRKLLLVEATTFMPVMTPPSWRPAKRPAFPARTRSDPARVAAGASARFNLNIPRDERFVPDDRAPRIRALWAEPTVLTPPAAARPQNRRSGLASRFAALQRVIANPARYARRLAVRLAQIARHERARRALRFACRGPDRVAPGFGGPLRDAGRLVFACAARLGDTS